MLQTIFDRTPRLAPRMRNHAFISRWPVTVAVMKRLSPSEDLALGELWQSYLRPKLAPNRHKANQRLTSGQTACAFLQSILHALPGFSRGLRYGPRVLARPLAGAAVMRFGPGQDLVDRQRRATHMRAHAPMMGQQTKQARATQAATTFAQRFGDGQPGVPVRLLDWTAIFRGPVAAPSMMRVRPPQDLADRQAGPRSKIGHIPFDSQKLGQRRSAWHSPPTVSQRHVDRQPAFTVRAGDRAAVVVRPFSHSSMMGIRPLQDLGSRVFGECLAVALAAMLRQEPGQRLAATKSTKPQSQRLIDVHPLLIGRFPDPTAMAVRPLACARMQGVGPGEYLFDGQFGATHIPHQSTLTELDFQARSGGLPDVRARWPRRGPGWSWPHLPTNEKDARFRASGWATWRWLVHRHGQDAEHPIRHLVVAEVGKLDPGLGQSIGFAAGNDEVPAAKQHRAFPAGLGVLARLKSAVTFNGFNPSYSPSTCNEERAIA